MNISPSGAMRAGPALRYLAGVLWPRQEGNCGIPQRRKAAHDKSLCHHAHKAGAERMLLWRFQSGSGLVSSIFQPRSDEGQYSQG